MKQSASFMWAMTQSFYMRIVKWMQYDSLSPITAMHDFVVALNTCFATIKPIGSTVQDVTI